MGSSSLDARLFHSMELCADHSPSFTLTLTRRMAWSQTIPLYLTLGDPWTPLNLVLSPPHHGEAQRGEDTCLQSHSMPTGDLVPNLLLSHPTHARRNQHLYYPESITQPSKLEPWRSPVPCKVDKTEGRTNSFIMVGCCFFQTDSIQERNTMEKRQNKPK